MHHRPKMQNAQEELMRVLAENSMGAPFVFVPDKWQKRGGKWREPADLAWMGRDCAILMYLKRKQPRGVPGRETFDSLVSGNLLQAKGWLRIWRSGGANLCGKNRFREFHEQFSEHLQIVVLSIVECDGAHFEAHDDRARELDVAACLSIPFSVMAALARMGAALMDLIMVLQQLSASNSSIPEQDALTLVQGYEEAAWRDSGAGRLWTSKNDPRYAEAANHFYGLRIPWQGPINWPGTGILQADMSSDCAAVFNDITLRETLNLITAAGFGIRLARTDRSAAEVGLPADMVERPFGERPEGSDPLRPPDQWVMPVALSHYDFLLCFAKGSRLAYEFGGKLLQLSIEKSRYGRDHPCPALVFDVDRQVTWACLIREKGAWPSATRQILDRW